MKKVLLDTNIVLDIALKREPHFSDSSQIFNLIDKELIEAAITATAVTDLYYIARKEKSNKQAKSFIIDLTKIIEIIGVDKEIIIDALNSNIKDFEDAVQVFAAEYNEIEAIITRNKKDFQSCDLEILSPKELVHKIVK